MFADSFRFKVGRQYYFEEEIIFTSIATFDSIASSKSQIVKPFQLLLCVGKNNFWHSHYFLTPFGGLLVRISPLSDDNLPIELEP